MKILRRKPLWLLVGLLVMLAAINVQAGSPRASLSTVVRDWEVPRVGA